MFWRKPHGNLDEIRTQSLANIERNRVALADMVMRAAAAGAPGGQSLPPAALPPAPAGQSPAPGGAAVQPPAPGAPGTPPPAPAAVAGLDIARVQARFEDLVRAAKTATDEEQLQQLVEEAEALATLRANICPEKEITTEAKSYLLTLRDWGVPAAVLDSLRDTAAPALTGTDVPAARGGLHVVYEEYDVWSSYVDTYNRKTRWWATTLLVSIALVALASLLIMLGWSASVLALFAAAVAGAMTSVIARLPGLTSYGEWMVNLRAFQARIATGIIGSLVGIGLLGSGLIAVTLPAPWDSTDLLFRSCLAHDTTANQGGVTAPGSAGGTKPTVAPGAAGKAPGRCTPGGALFLISITMLLGFSERLLTSLESRILPASASPAK